MGLEGFLFIILGILSLIFGIWGTTITRSSRLFKILLVIITIGIIIVGIGVWFLIR